MNRLLLPAALWLLPAIGFAVPLAGDLNGDGAIDVADEPWLAGLYGGASGDSVYDPAGDLNADGRIDYLDLALFGAGFGASGGDLDTTPPGLVVTLNDIPADMNYPLVVPPDGFRITLHLDSAGGAVVDTGSLSITASQDMGVHPAGSELASLFSVSPTRAVWEVPAGTDLDRVSHFLDVAISDAAGNVASDDSYGFAVRDFDPVAPLGSLQTLFLDFDQDRSLTPELDFIEDLREYGLSSSAAPTIETQMRDRLVTEIVERARVYYGLLPDGTPGADAVNIDVVSSQPGVSHSRLCVGGESSQGGSFLGNAILDVNNTQPFQDECPLGSFFGVFPQAIDNLWSADAGYQAAFGPVDPGLGGTPVGEDPLDATVVDPSFDPATATAAELARWNDIENAVDAFAQTVAGAAAHETGHMLGLVAHGPVAGGLYGGSSGQKTDHNVTPGGQTPPQNFLMNAGGSFSFDEITGRNGQPLPVFRPLGWAYLRDRVVLDDQVTGIFDPPQLTAVVPDSVSYDPGPDPPPIPLAFEGMDFMDPPLVVLIREGDPTPDPVSNLVFLDPQNLTGEIYLSLVPPATYDVQVINPDGQTSTLVDGLLVEQQP